MNATEAGATHITVEAQDANGGGMLIVVDDGPGMAPDVQAHAFDPFFTAKRKATGLGLAIAQEVKLSGTGADVMKRIAAPMVGGLATSFLLELLVYPAIYFLWKKRELRRDAAPELA